jgi:hypothetical protein
LAAGEGVEPSALRSKRSVLPVTPSRIEIADSRLLIADWCPETEESFVVRIGNRQRFWLWRKDSNLRMAALTVRCLTNLATPQYDWDWWMCAKAKPFFPYVIFHFSFAI